MTPIIHKGFTILPDQREVIGGVTFFAVERFSDLAYCPRHRMLVDVGGEMTEHVQRHRDEQHDRWEHES